MRIFFWRSLWSGYSLQVLALPSSGCGLFAAIPNAIRHSKEDLAKILFYVFKISTNKLNHNNMKETIYKSLLLSLLITNLWAAITFFVYYFDTGLFSGFKTLLLFGWSCWISSGLGLLIILISLLKIWKSNQSKVFLLVFTGWFNIFFSLLLITTTYFEIIVPESFIYSFYIVNLIIPIVVYFRTKKIIKNYNNK